MCGINVIYDSEASSESIHKMNKALVHRGPDSKGVYHSTKSPLSLGSQRLKILDLENGDMPYRSHCGRYAMVYNGELYNHLKLKSLITGYNFESHSDGEVLFALLQSFGPSILSQCNGMFAFAFWDEQEQQLTIARDRLGIKPLFYAFQDQKLYLSSELPALKELPCLKQELNHEAMYHYLSLLSIPEPHTIYKNIHRFPKGHYAQFQHGSMCIKRYWDISFKKHHHHEAQCMKDIQELFYQSVERRLMSDVPFGLLLSAGIDSNILAHTVTNEFDLKLNCYSLGFESGEDESSLAEQSAKELNLPFSKHSLKAESLLEQIPNIIQHFGEPFAGGLPIWFLCREISQDITVGLTGTGGDELFGNYGRPQHIFPNLGWVKGLKFLFKHPKTRSPSFESLNYTLQHGAPLGHFYHEKVYPVKEGLKQSLLKNQLGIRTDEFLERHLWKNHDINPYDRIFELDLKTQLSEEFLFSQDILSMAHHMELRVPFLDHNLVEYLAKTPSVQRSQSFDPKAWMRKVFAKHIPKHILNQPKRGFMIPYGKWLRHELKSSAESLIQKDFIHDQNIFNYKALKSLWDEHLSGKDHSYALWSIFMFQIWFFQQHQVELKWMK